MLLKGQKMTNLDFDAIIIALIVIVCGGGMVWLVIWGIIDQRKKNQKMYEEMEQPLVEIPLFECKATVVEKFCQRENRGGVRIPNTQECCYIVVKTIDGRLHKCSVPLENYCNVKVNQEVTVALENNKVFDISFE